MKFECHYASIGYVPIVSHNVGDEVGDLIAHEHVQFVKSVESVGGRALFCVHTSLWDL